MKDWLGKVLFGSLFMLVLPVVLLLWAQYTAHYVLLPLPNYTPLSYVLIVLGAILVVGAMYQLWKDGKGLPMNAFPPKIFVRKGFYALVPHPIYVGAVLLSFGISWSCQSASGFWLVSVIFAFMCVAYVYGFEREQIEKVFGKQRLVQTLNLPGKFALKANVFQRLNTAFLVFVPWVLLYEAFILFGVPQDFVFSNVALDAQIPFIEFFVIFYTLTYPFAILIPFAIKRQDTLRSFGISGWLLTAMGILLFLFFPFVVAQEEVIGSGFFAQWIVLERAKDGVSAAFPAFHAAWAIVGACYYSKEFPKLKGIIWVFSILIVLSCLFVKMHSIADVLLGVLLAFIACYYPIVLAYVMQFFERIANSWKEWRFGSVRVINHGFYAGLAGFAGAMVLGIFLPQSAAYAGFALAFSAIVGAALWAQIIEGSPLLLRPYGYYGSVLGVLFCSLGLILLSDLDLWLLLASAALAAPWVQVIGRLRCLVQGCCHGKTIDGELGICFHKPISRVNKISGLLGKRLHATQVYSLLSNVLIGLFLFRMVSLQMPAVFLIGMYLVLNGLARFVEEAYRGEAQTPYWKGMRIYQWIAMLNVLAGFVFTCLPQDLVLQVQFNWDAFYWSAALAVFAIFAYGVDFPESNKPFARLTS
jgi:protein-S-isoprenylcysteine O-methyltransferase Ste14